jgi:XTP/dITP diphosphohydrolase
MNESVLLVATRSSHKLREILSLLPPLPSIRIVDLESASVPLNPQEDTIERFETFEANALAKARYFVDLVGLPVLADDSGLCVDALDGAPGVRSRRFSGRMDLTGRDLDLANNETLLEALQNVSVERRTARYVCVIAIATPDGREEVFKGCVGGTILREPRGTGGFGYDSLFFVPSIGATFAEVPPETKNAISHRRRALSAAILRLRQLTGTSHLAGESRPPRR